MTLFYKQSVNHIFYYFFKVVVELLGAPREGRAVGGGPESATEPGAVAEGEC